MSRSPDCLFDSAPQVMYEATDAAGNTAQARRLVTVYDSCTEVGEVRCPNTLRCSMYRNCTLSGDIIMTSTAYLQGYNDDPNMLRSKV